MVKHLVRITKAAKSAAERSLEEKTSMPWWIKLPFKILLSELGLHYALLKKIGINRHGMMDQPKYACDIFLRHFRKFEACRHDRPFVMLELGPGDSLFSGLIAFSFGASGTYLVDAEPATSTSVEKYKAMVEYLERLGNGPPQKRRFETLAELQEQCNIRYFTDGLMSLRSIPSESVDFIWSQAVLEHVKRDEFPEILGELRRIVRPSGLCSHRIDLRDHLSGGLNHLRFRTSVWESDLIRRTPIYTNRFRCSEILRLFEETGFLPKTVEVEYFETMPIPRNKLSEDFVTLPDEELMISGFDVLLECKEHV